MKKFKMIFIALFATLFLAQSASAQFKWGLQAGIVANDLKFSNKMFDASNRVGFTGGVTAQFDFIFGLAVQGSLNYVHRVSQYTDQSDNETSTFKADYLTLPIHLKYNFSIPAVSGLFRPFLYTGPSFSYLVSKRKNLNYGLSKGDIEWDLGLGFDIVKHIQINVGYGFGLYKIIDFGGGKVRTNTWTITLGYLF